MPAARLRDAQIVVALSRRLEKADPSTLTNFAWFAARRGERQAALDAARAAVAMPDAPRAAWLALERLAAGDHPGMLLATMSTGSDLLSLGHSLLRHAHFGDALTLFDQVLLDQPSQSAALFLRGVVLAKLRRYGEALEDWERVGRADAESELGDASRRHAESARKLVSLFAER